MPDLRRSESLRAADTADRDSQTEALLVDGLDRYFSGHFEDAIHLWTRVLFLDRSHARARAYIDRARTALAERQRRSDEMLHATDDLLAQGRTEAARDLLTAAVATSGDDERASALRLRLERLERAHAAARVGGGQRIKDVQRVPGWSWRTRSRMAVAAFAAVATILLLIVAFGGASAPAWLGWNDGAGRLAGTAGPVRLPVLTGAEVALVRARALYTRGRLGEALVALDRVGVDSPSRAAADQLRVDIQELLLSGRGGVVQAADAGGVRR
jgi:hypothetical protein